MIRSRTQACAKQWLNSAFILIMLAATTSVSASSRIGEMELVFTDELCVVSEDELSFHESFRQILNTGLCPTIEDSIRSVVPSVELAQAPTGRGMHSLSIRWTSLAVSLVKKQGWVGLLVLEWELRDPHGRLISIRQVESTTSAKPGAAKKLLEQLLREVSEDSKQTAEMLANNRP